MARRGQSWEAGAATGAVAVTALALVLCGVGCVRGLRLIATAFSVAPHHRGLWISAAGTAVSLLLALVTQGAPVFLVAAGAGVFCLVCFAQSVVGSSTKRAGDPLGLDQVIETRWMRTEE